ncbi:tRNA pseudouridine(38-40) synthase TruA [Compostibacter hankyongensis]|uniref:tRNA pseudouridine synthase A n=1 Tax=Compostibacter hankyongensis TaxID=1007089 RepID=A0ABP8FTZ8_9BACT
MARYFIEVAYCGAGFSGFQTQQNGLTVQGELERALSLLTRRPVSTTGASRTDAGVHAFQNFLHFDSETPLHPGILYKMNALLPRGIAVKAVYPVADTAHARFDAVSRAYEYVLYAHKDPFLQGRGYHFPYPLQLDILRETAALIREHRDFRAFSKRNTQVKTFVCNILSADWEQADDRLIFRIRANRFLRGMVRGLVGTQLLAGRGRLGMDDFRRVLDEAEGTRADFSAPAQGLFLKEVAYPEGLLTAAQRGIALKRGGKEKPAGNLFPLF